MHKKLPERKRDKFGLEYYIGEEKKLLVDPEEIPVWTNEKKLDKLEYTGPFKEPVDEKQGEEKEKEENDEDGSESGSEDEEEEVRDWYKKEDDHE